MAFPFRVYDTLRRSIVPFSPRRPGHVGLYVCGMTVYDHAHVGHARAMVVFDALVRYLRHRGWDVTYVRNHTDVDDKIIRRARERGEDPLERAQRFVDAFEGDMAALGLLRPDAEPRVTRSIPAIVAMIEALIAKGHAYAAPSGDVWFAVATFAAYGALSRQRGEHLDASPDEDTGKRDRRDFALWKAARPGEPSWAAPWGAGRPGWHIECSAMAREALGDALDIHGGGLDLVFPHHENEIAQSECAHGPGYAGHWMHNGLLVTSGGAKIARSEGNGAAIREVLARMPAEALRFAYLRAHYRSPLAWDERAIDDALSQLARLYEALEAAAELRGEGDPDRCADELGDDARMALELARSFEERVHDALDDDFDTPRAVVHAIELARAMQRMSQHPRARRHGAPIARLAIASLQSLRRTLGVLASTPAQFDDEVRRKLLPRLGLDEVHVESRLAARTGARARRDFDEADAIRAELESLGLDIRDAPDGTRWRVRL
ncbi:MAG: cysteine--tRNA ligase [Myxococcota bacterium]|nr:cysteine--tRNA ligase [Myxococcota bacterium]